MNDPVARACAILGMANGSAFARGSAGLYALLRAIALRDGPGEVVIPSICCETVGLAAVYAGHELRIADVSRDSLCLTPQTVGPLMSPRTRAVLVVHIFGIDADASSFRTLRAAFPRAVFIENVAHAIGGYSRSGRPLGADLDCALLSFAGDKIVPGGGGMILYAADSRCPPADAVEASIHAAAPRLPQPRLALSLRNLTHALADLWREQPGTSVAPAFSAVMKQYRSLVACGGGLADEAAVVAGLDRLAAVRDGRYQRYRRYRDRITTPHARPISAIHECCTCWRCPVLFADPARASSVTAALRAQGIHASNHYLPLNLLFGGEALSESEFVGARILNLWVDDGVPDSMIDAAIDLINRLA